jgi:hypothetical protein
MDEFMSGIKTFLKASLLIKGSQNIGLLDLNKLLLFHSKLKSKELQFRAVDSTALTRSSKMLELIFKVLKSQDNNDNMEFINKLLCGGFDSGDSSLISKYASSLSKDDLNQFSKSFWIEDSEGEKWGLSELFASLVNSTGNLQKTKGG